MNNIFLNQKILSLPLPKAKKIIGIAKIGVALLFITVMVCTAIAGWFLFTSPYKLVPVLCLIILGVVSFFGGRLHGYVHDTESHLATETQTFNLDIPKGV